MTAVHPRFDYLRCPEAIYRLSFERVREATDLSGFDPDTAEVVVRIVHACGMPEIAGAIRYTPDAVSSARGALAAGRPVITDSRMTQHGIIRSRLPRDNPVLCPLDDARTAALAAGNGDTRSAAAVALWRERLAQAVVVIGNAPTALFRLLEVLAAGAPRPAAVLAFPVGFVGAAESCRALIEHHDGIPYITLTGRRGGSAMAAAALNAVAAGVTPE